MKLSKEYLNNVGACQSGVEWFCGQTETDGIKVVGKLIKQKQNEWANWIMARMLDKVNKVRYAIYSAELVIDIFEKKYPNDNRPRKSIECAKAWIENPTEENRLKCAYASESAYTSASASARNKHQIKILKYGIKLLKSQEASNG